MNKEIGGYFGLELLHGQEYHADAIHLNSGRSALQYLLKTKQYQKIYLPAYICDSVLTPINAEGITYEYYSITSSFEPIFEKDINENEAFLYVNYFGINDEMVKSVVTKYQNVIIDNTQAFYSMPEPGIDTFYSARKYFGVADGAYLYTDIGLNEQLDVDVSYDRMGHLLRRLDESANAGYALFRENSDDIDKSGLRMMSNLTKHILSGVDYEKCAKQRRENYQYLHAHLGDMNQLNLNDLGDRVPMIYPFYCENEGLRDYLIQNKIYVATYWNDVLDHVENNSQEALFTKNLLALPIDQRYSIEDMNHIVQLVNEEVQNV